MTADSEKSFPVAIIVPNLLELEKHLIDLGKTTKGALSEHADFAKIPECKQYVFEALIKTWKTCNMKPAEKLGGIELAKEDWTPQNGFLVFLFSDFNDV
jgi:long-subunit acyl-CoA synthetase (AMP-forming)